MCSKTKEDETMSSKKSKLLLCLLLFLAMFLLPLISLGGSPSGKQGGSGASGETRQSSSGQFHLLDTATNSILTVGDADFLYGAVAAEMSPLAEPEALKAQAVATYTYYSRLRENSGKSASSAGKGYDFTVDTKNWQIYVPEAELRSRWSTHYDDYSAKLKSAVDGVRGQVLRSGGSLIDATYFAISSGSTEASEDVWGSKYPYLVSVASPMDMFAGGYQTTAAFSEQDAKSRLLKLVPSANLDGPASGWFGAASRSAAGGVKTIPVGGQSVDGASVRSAFGLRSANFTVAYAQQNGFTFTVKGYGHGVGMSQAGAQAMAADGSTYRDILAWYYPTAELGTL